MLSFLRRNQVLFSAFLSVLVSLYIIAPAAKGQHRADPIGPLLIAVMRPLQSAIQSTVFGVRDFFGGSVARRGAAGEKWRLRPGVGNPKEKKAACSKRRRRTSGSAS